MSPALFLLLHALAGQPAPDDGPLRTAPAEAPEGPAIGLDEARVDVAAQPPAPEAGKFEPRTLVDVDTLQVVRGQRALFMLDDKGLPVLLRVEEGQLAEAHPPGTVVESFAPPPKGQFAVALDGSAETRATILKVWNETDRALDYRAVALVFGGGGKLSPAPAPVCAAPPRSIRIETWRRPIVAAALNRFNETVTTRACQ